MTQSSKPRPGARSRPTPKAISDLASSLTSSEEEIDLRRLKSPRKARTVLDERAVRTVEAALKAGLPLPQTAGLIGVTFPTMKRWLERGVRSMEEGSAAPEDEIYERLAVAVQFACSDHAHEMAQLVKLHALKNPQAAIALLKAQDLHGVWAEKSTIKVETETNGRLEDLSQWSDEDLRLKAEYEEMLATKRIR